MSMAKSSLVFQIKILFLSYDKNIAICDTICPTALCLTKCKKGDIYLSVLQHTTAIHNCLLHRVRNGIYGHKIQVYIYIQCT